MTSLQTLLNRIKELNEKRTPGEWLLNNRIHADRRQIITGEAAICCFCCHWDEPNFIIEKVKNDAQFIATLANECAKLVKVIQVQNDALKQVYDNVDPYNLGGEAQDAIENVWTALEEVDAICSKS